MNWPRVSGESTGFDIDSVFSDLSELLIRIAEEVYGVHLKEEQFTDFYLERCLPFDPSFVEEWVGMALTDHWTFRMKPMDGSVRVLTGIGQHHRLHFITARKEERSIREWVRRQLPEVPQENLCVLAVGSFDGKVRALKELGLTCFIEDRVETCQLLYENGLYPILYHQPWNAHWNGFPRVRDWKEIEDLFQRGGFVGGD